MSPPKAMGATSAMACPTPQTLRRVTECEPERLRFPQCRSFRGEPRALPNREAGGQQRVEAPDKQWRIDARVLADARSNGVVESHDARGHVQPSAQRIEKRELED